MTQRAQWIPEVNQAVYHKSGVIFMVQRRTRTKDESGRVTGIRLWDSPSGEGGVYFPLDECSPLDEMQVLEQFELSMNGKTITVRPIWNDDSSVTLALSQGDRIVGVQIPNFANQVVLAAHKFAKAFSGNLLTFEDGAM